MTVGTLKVSLNKGKVRQCGWRVAVLNVNVRGLGPGVGYTISRSTIRFPVPEATSVTW